MTITPELTNEKAALGLVHPVFLYVGRLIRLKGLQELLQAWSRFRQTEGPKGTLLLVGDGPERGPLESMARELQLSNVLFTGAIPYEDTALYYSLADIFVMPSLEDKWSLVVPEAMSGLPILCSIYNGCWPELVREGENGWVFDPQKPEELARLFSLCLRERERLPPMGLASGGIVKGFSPRIAGLRRSGCVQDCGHEAVAPQRRVAPRRKLRWLWVLSSLPGKRRESYLPRLRTGSRFMSRPLEPIVAFRSAKSSYFRGAKGDYSSS